MTSQLTVLAFVLAASTATAQPPAGQAPAAPNQAPAAPNQAPEFKVEVWGPALAEFGARIDAYAALRESLSVGIPRLAVTDDPAEILKAETALAERVRKARANAKRGDIFSSRIRAAFRRALAMDLNEGICASIRDDGPAAFVYSVNGTYPKNQALSTVPPTLLAAMPKLPADVMYRFIGRDLILHDTRANIILDRVDEAIGCR